MKNQERKSITIIDKSNYKVDEIQNRLCLENEFDIICLSETWLKPQTDVAKLHIPGYCFIHRPRHSHGGGVAMYYRETLPIQRRQDLEHPNLEILWQQLPGKGGHIFIGVCYSPPGRNMQQADTFIDNLTECIGHAMDKNPVAIYLLGDFNDQCRTWHGSHDKSELKYKLHDSINSLGLYQLVTEPTHFTSHSANLLDLIITDAPGYTIDVGTLPPICTSHHCVTYCAVSISVDVGHSYNKDIWLYDEADWVGLNAALEMSNLFENVHSFTDINHILHHWMDNFRKLLETYIPHKTITVHPKDKPWINSHIKQCIRNRDRLFKRYKRTRKVDHYWTYQAAKYHARSEMDTAKQLHRDKLTNQLANPKISSKEYWKIKKQLIGGKIVHGIPPINVGGNLTSDDMTKANAFTQYFASQSQAPRVQHEIKQMQNIFQSKLQVPQITVEEVQKILLSLNIGKANGPDNISNTILKHTARTVASSITAIINYSLSIGNFPDDWKIANITPIFKKGDKQNVQNYRPVSLLSNIGKVMERAVYKKLCEHCEANGILTWRNAGFKKNEGTINQLLYLNHTIYNNLNNGKDTAMIFLDASKAFDRIWHKGLLWKLKKIGVCDNLCEWFNSYLKDRKIRTVVHGKSSDWYKISAGVPQGSILGQLLFLIYVNDIVEDIKCEILLYADDTSLICSFDKDNMSESFQKLNGDLSTLTNWAYEWHMDFNAAKSEYVIFSNKKNINYPALSMDNQNLERVKEHTHLGLTLDETMNWDSHISKVTNKATKRISTLWKLNEVLPRRCLENYYFHFVRPILEYACICFDNCSKAASNRLESVQRKAAIACTRAYQRTSHVSLLSELAWPTLAIRRQVYKLSTMYKIINNNTPNYIKSLIPQQRGQTVISHILRNELQITIPRCRLKSFSTSFIPDTIRMWNETNNDLKTSRSLPSFKNALKKTLFPGKVKNNAELRGKSAINLCRMRMGLSALNSQREQYHLIENSSCNKCNNGKEDITHYFLTCPQYAAQRGTLIRELGQLLQPAGITPTKIKNNVLLNIIIHGCPILNYDQNMNLLESTLKYIGDTKRFI